MKELNCSYKIAFKAIGTFYWNFILKTSFKQLVYLIIFVFIGKNLVLTE
jgi:hypothetical protein